MCECARNKTIKSNKTSRQTHRKKSEERDKLVCKEENIHMKRTRKKDRL